jgi:predicted regulator of Ras-like GTPase activity (Roadblock/LC7/MglB family)
MIMWNQVKLRFKNPPDRKIIRRIQSDIMGVLMEASRRKDEKSNPENSPEELSQYSANPENLPELDANRYVMETILPYPKDSVEESADRDSNAFITSPVPDRIAPVEPGQNFPIRQLEELLKLVAEEIGGTGFVTVFDRDGIRAAGHPPAFLLADAYSAHLSMLMNMGRNSVKALTGETEMEEQMIQTTQSWIICRPINSMYFLGIVTDKSAGLGNIRLVFHKYIETLKKLM